MMNLLLTKARDGPHRRHETDHIDGYELEAAEICFLDGQKEFKQVRGGEGFQAGTTYYVLPLSNQLLLIRPTVAATLLSLLCSPGLPWQSPRIHGDGLAVRAEVQAEGALVR
eukprot:scaffold63214_cov46-Phaeocystis_antarctica.AAC.2